MSCVGKAERSRSWRKDPNRNRTGNLENEGKEEYKGKFCLSPRFRMAMTSSAVLCVVFKKYPSRMAMTVEKNLKNAKFSYFQFFSTVIAILNDLFTRYSIIASSDGDLENIECKFMRYLFVFTK